MPNLPRIPRTVRRRQQAPLGQPVVPAEPRVSELEHAGARWLNIEEPTLAFVENVIDDLVDQVPVP